MYPQGLGILPSPFATRHRILARKIMEPRVEVSTVAWEPTMPAPYIIETPDAPDAPVLPPSDEVTPPCPPGQVKVNIGTRSERCVAAKPTIIEPPEIEAEPPDVVEPEAPAVGPAKAALPIALGLGLLLAFLK